MAYFMDGPQDVSLLSRWSKLFEMRHFLAEGECSKVGAKRHDGVKFMAISTSNLFKVNETNIQISDLTIYKAFCIQTVSNKANWLNIQASHKYFKYKRQFTCLLMMISVSLLIFLDFDFYDSPLNTKALIHLLKFRRNNILPSSLSTNCIYISAI